MANPTHFKISQKRDSDLDVQTLKSKGVAVSVYVAGGELAVASKPSLIARPALVRGDTGATVLAGLRAAGRADSPEQRPARNLLEPLRAQKRTDIRNAQETQICKPHVQTSGQRTEIIQGLGSRT